MDLVHSLVAGIQGELHINGFAVAFKASIKKARKVGQVLVVRWEPSSCTILGILTEAQLPWLHQEVL